MFKSVVIGTRLSAVTSDVSYAVGYRASDAIIVHKLHQLLRGTAHTLYNCNHTSCTRERVRQCTGIPSATLRLTVYRCQERQRVVHVPDTQRQWFVALCGVLRNMDK